MDWASLHGSAFKGHRVLVTGAAGFIGSHLTAALVELGATVAALDDLSNGQWSNLDGFDATVEKHTASILDPAALAKATAGCRYVFHEAALGSVPRSVEQPDLYYNVNVLGTVNVLKAAKEAGATRVIFAGSSSAYGDPPTVGLKVETQPPLPRSPYAATKLAGEHSMRAWAHSYGLDTAVTRYFNIFGPRQNPNSAYAAVIAAFAKAMHHGQRGLIFGDGEQSRDFTHVANAVHANLLAARHDKPLLGEVFNVACGTRISVNLLHEKMAELYGLGDAMPTYKPGRKGDVAESQADIGKAKRVLGYEPIVDFEAGLAQTVAWYREHFTRADSTA
ncbi:MAG: NAD-dependent epimerase/dehydratase family protein [Planctomycetes bacterium]|nr:NAD-dependent epimerase/dehydratase family protein [Planctomycetota bacterium]